MDNSNQPDEHDAEQYGRSFSDVYDDWYPANDQSEAAIEYLTHLAEPAERILELGVGTGRLALPLALHGYAVDGIDASAEMLATLDEKLADLNNDNTMVEVRSIVGDVVDPTAWPNERYSVILGAFNLLFNITASNGIETVFRLAASHLNATGVFVVETFEPELPDRVSSEMTVKSVSVAGVELIATTTDPATQQVVGQHIELRTQTDTTLAEVHLRPWTLRVATLAQLDEFAEDAGLVLQRRFHSWADARDDAEQSASRRTSTHGSDQVHTDFDGAGIVSVYARPVTS